MRPSMNRDSEHTHSKAEAMVSAAIPQANQSDSPAPLLVFSNTLFSNAFCSFNVKSPGIPGPPAPTPSSAAAPCGGE